MIRAVLVSLAVVVIVAGAGGPAPAQCAGDCDVDGQVTVDELVRLARVMLGMAVPLCPVSDGNCSAPPASPGPLTPMIEGIIGAVNVALTAKAMTVLCLQPGPGPAQGTDNFIGCDKGTVVCEFGCPPDSPKCMDAQRQLATGSTDNIGFVTRELGECGALSAGSGLNFVAHVGDSVYHTAVAGRPGSGTTGRAAEAGGTAARPTPDVIISPDTEAATNILSHCGQLPMSNCGHDLSDCSFEKLAPEAISQVIAAVDLANAHTSFAGLTPAMAAAAAFSTAAVDCNVQDTIRRNLPPTPTPTLTGTATVSATPTPTSTFTLTPTRTPEHFLAFVANSFDDTVSVIDTRTREVLAIPVKKNPQQVAVSPDGSLVCVSDYGATNENGYLSIISVADRAVVATIPTCPPNNPTCSPYGLQGVAFPPDNSGVLFAANIQTQTLFRYNIGDPSQKSALAIDKQPYAIAIAPTPGIVYVTKAATNLVQRALPTPLNRLGAPILVGATPHGIAIRPASVRHPAELALVANFGADSVSVINLATNTAEPTPVRVDQEPESIAVTSNGDFAYVTNRGSGTVSIIDTDMAVSSPTNARVGNVSVESEGCHSPFTYTPFGVAITGDGFVYVTNGACDTVSVIDTHLVPPVVIQTIDVGSAPRGIAITPFEVP